jgi:hypothetical protein
MPKLCKDCKWIDHRLLYALPDDRLCRHSNFQTDRISPVDGEFAITNVLCIDNRDSWKECGPEAKWYEPKAYLLHIESLGPAPVESKVRARPPSISMRGRSYKTDMADLI